MTGWRLKQFAAMAAIIVPLCLGAVSLRPPGSVPNPVQLLDEHGSLDRAAADAHLAEAGFSACGLDYGVVAVIGPQSSGKSSLLNALFDTDFSRTIVQLQLWVFKRDLLDKLGVLNLHRFIWIYLLPNHTNSRSQCSDVNFRIPRRQISPKSGNFLFKVYNKA